MTTFLERILATKREEVKALEQFFIKNPPHLELTIPCRGFRNSIVHSDGLAVIAEIKKASPSKGLIAPNFHPAQTAKSYEMGQAAAISVLTDVQFFQGCLNDLHAVQSSVAIPVLRKDFIIDESQIVEARIAGADAILLICAALSPLRVRELSHYAHSLGLDVLIEVHNVDELDSAMAAAPTVIGVNNRDLHSFEVHLETTETVIQHLPADIVVISESGIHSVVDAERMAGYGARGILVGESLMRMSQVTADISSLLKSFQVSVKERWRFQSIGEQK